MTKSITKIKDRNAYIVGGGIGGLATAFFLIRDGKMPGSSITIFEELEVMGGACDAKGNSKDGYFMRGGRMLNLPTYECTWTMLKDVPSLTSKNVSVYDEVLAYNKKWKININARLIGENREILNSRDMQFSTKDKIDLIKLVASSEHHLSDKRIDECFNNSFFKTNFWCMWTTTFAFETWHSAIELRRYLIRFMHEFHNIHNLSGINRTPYNQYESLILPILKYLENNGVNFKRNTSVTDLKIEENVDGSKSVKSLLFTENSHNHTLKLNENDVVIATVGSMTENSSIGSQDIAPKFNLNKLGNAWQLWKNIAKGRKELGNPDKFISNVDKSFWESFSITSIDGHVLLNNFCELDKNIPGNTLLMTFKNSSWLITYGVPHQPYFINQLDNVKVMWGYALLPNNIGNYVKKPMRDCSGSEILTELCYHHQCLDKLEKVLKSTKCIPCLMPYITSQFMPRNLTDRPQIVPEGYTNLGLIGQYSEIEHDTVFTIEYSVRGAQIAVYSLLGLDKKTIPKVSEHNKEFKVILESFEMMMSKGK